jgi:hypothetical protein
MEMQLATILPENFDADSLNHSERAVLKALVEKLSDDWILVPHVTITVDRVDREIDILAISRFTGGVVIEVKGGSIEVRDGNWFQGGRRIKNPAEQAMEAKHVLVKRLKTMKIDYHGFFIGHAVCFPDVVSVPKDGFGLDCPANMVIGARELQWPHHILEQCSSSPVASADPEIRRRILQALCPTIDSTREFGEYFSRSTSEFESNSRDVLLIAKLADRNKRLSILGGAGSGKTAVVRSWAKRAVERGERVLAVCFNKPVSELLVPRYFKDKVTHGTFHDVLVRLLQPLGFEVPNPPTPDFWSEGLAREFLGRIDQIEERFDTVIVDEAQDFSPLWLEALTALLDPDGPGRVLIAADPTQDIYQKGFVEPEGFFTLVLPFNLRNSRMIAVKVAPWGGGQPYEGNPIGFPPRFLKADGIKIVRKKLRDEISMLVDQHGVAPSAIMVLTTRAEVRDRLIREDVERIDNEEPFDLVSWEERSEDKIVCQTVHRAKGLESSAIILVSQDEDIDDRLLYVGASRARLWLTVVGTEELGRRFGLTE